MAKFSLLSLFPSMPLGSCAQTLDFKGAAVRPSYLLPEPLFRGQMFTSLFHGCDPWRTWATSVYVLALLWCWYIRPVFHLVICKPPQALPSNEEGEETKSAEESKLQIHSTRVTRHCLLPPCPQRCCVDVSLTVTDFPVNVSCLFRASGHWLVQWQLLMGFCYSLVRFLCH